MAEATHPTDRQFYQPADTFFPGQQGLALTYDDVTLATAYSDVLPSRAALDTKLTDSLALSIPVVSADMDTVTESGMAIAMALNGGLGILHYNMPHKRQLSEVSRVKNNIHGLIQDPIKVHPDELIGDVLEMIEERGFGFRTFPVVDRDGKLLGLLPGHTVKQRYASHPVARAMLPREQVHTIPQSRLGQDPIAVADRFFDEFIGIHKLLVVDEADHLHGLFTISDVERIMHESNQRFKPARDSKFRLLCGAALSATRDASGGIDRDSLLGHVDALVDRGVDVVAVSTAHGFSEGVAETVRLVRNAFPELPVIAGNVTSADGVEFLAKAGADAVKVGQGPGSICTTRIVAGVGIPQLTALYVCSKAAKEHGVRIIADGGVTKSGDIVKALTLADCVMCGSLLAGCPEAPGQIMEIDGKLYKQYRGMGSLAAMQAGSAARYGHSKNSQQKVAPEGVEALKEVSPPLESVLGLLVGGVQSGMGYLGAATLGELRANARYIRVSPAGQRESSPHDIVEVKTTN